MTDRKELKRQYRISFIAFLCTGVVASVSTGYIYFTTRSLIFLLQFLLSLSGMLIHGIYLWISRTLYLNDSRERAHYHGKLESFATFIGVFIVYVNLIILFGVSVLRIISPDDIAEMTMFSKIATYTCVIYNLVLIARCRISVNKTGNVVMRAQLIESAKNLLSWILCAITDVVATFFPEWMLAPFVEPVMCIVLVFVVGYFYAEILKGCTLDLLDKTGTVSLKKDIFRILSEFEGVSGASFRRCGKRIIVDVSLNLDPSLTWQGALDLSREINDRICTACPECHVHVKVDYE